MGKMGVYCQIKRLLKARTNQADKPVAKSEPWLEFRLQKVWDYSAAKSVYALYCYEIIDISPYSGVIGSWVEKGRGSRQWAERTAKHFKLELPQRLNQTVSDNGHARTLHLTPRERLIHK